MAEVRREVREEATKEVNENIMEKVQEKVWADIMGEVREKVLLLTAHMHVCAYTITTNNNTLKMQKLVFIIHKCTSLDGPTIKIKSIGTAITGVTTNCESSATSSG